MGVILINMRENEILQALAPVVREDDEEPGAEAADTP